MSNVSQVILFEYPLNEKMRTWLRVEFLLLQIYQTHSLTDISKSLAFFRIINELLDVIERGDLRNEILKELDRQQYKLALWSEMPGVDARRIDELQQQIRTCATQLQAAPRLGQELKEDKVIATVRQRLGIPGGCCSFDLPSLHTWMHRPQSYRDNQVQQWLIILAPLNDALKIILELIRQAGQFKEYTSINGFYQDHTESCDLLRMNIPSEPEVYPQVSGHKNRYAIRFLPLDPEKGSIPERLQFELACC